MKKSCHIFRPSISRGFTLIELLVVISIMAILIVALLATFNPGGQLKRGRDGQRKGELSQIRIALETYRADRASYPTTASFPACGNAFTSDGSTYMQKVPCDPLGGKYTYTRDDSTYTIFACLENTNDSQRDGADGSIQDKCSAAGRVSYTLQNP